MFVALFAINQHVCFRIHVNAAAFQVVGIDTFEEIDGQKISHTKQL